MDSVVLENGDVVPIYLWSFQLGGEDQKVGLLACARQADSIVAGLFMLFKFIIVCVVLLEQGNGHSLWQSKLIYLF